MWDVTKAISHLNSKAQPKSTFWCAKYVREAIGAGGLQLEPMAEARLYGPSLKKAGFAETSTSAPPFKTGDVVVIQSTSTVAPGHMAMFNGTIWVSDYRQTGSIYPGGTFDREKPRFVVYRYPQPAIVSPTLAHISKYRTAIQTAAKREGAPSTTVEEYLKFMEHGGGQGSGLSTKLGIFLAAADTAETAIKVAQFFFLLRKFGFSVVDAAKIFVIVVGLRAPRALAIIEHILKNGVRVKAGLKAAGDSRTALALFVAGVSIYNFCCDKEYGQAAATAYKTLIGIGVPWAGAIDSVQSFMPAADAKNTVMFKVLRACDPVGLGGAGIDSMIFGVQAMIEALQGKPFNDERLSQLVKRLKSGPTAIFAEFGEKIPIGAFIYDLSQMNAQSWHKLIQNSLPDLHNNMRNFRRRR